MRISKIIIPVVLVGAVSLSWTKFIGAVFIENANYKKCLQIAEESYKKGLYEQSVEYYKNSFDYRYDADIYRKICEICEKFYEEEQSGHAEDFYINNLMETIDAIPDESSYWLKAIHFYEEKEDYSSAYKIVKRARKNNIEDKELDAIYLELRYMTEIDYNEYDDYKTALNGYISVHDKNGWYVISGNGDTVSSDYYDFVGLINDDGVGVYKNSIDTRLLDGNGVVRARFDFDVEEAGLYSSQTGYIPVKIDGKWKYVNLDGEFLNGEYQMAGCFRNGKAAVKKDDSWYLIDSKGNKVSDDYEEIKLDLCGSYLQSDVILAKKGGSYSIYNKDFEKISNFSCDDIDVCLGSGSIAYCKDGKWGFVDVQGKVVCEPSYECAKSFSNGMAAVSNGEQWGFIDSNNQLVIDYKFSDAYYFNAYNYCVVSSEDDTFQLMYLIFE